MESNIASPIVVALDVNTLDDCLALARRLDPKLCRAKVGKELFTACGPAVVEALHNMGFDVFLDLKFHDIPATTAKAVKVAADLGVWMVNVHASGGSRMMTAAREAIAHYDRRPLLIGVTVLTSASEVELIETGIEVTAQKQVLKLASLAKNAGLDGVVCSAQEATALKRELGQEFKLVTPGIRPRGADAQDQNRIMTPSEAVAAGSDFLVIGRPITQAADPVAACANILKELGL